MLLLGTGFYVYSRALHAAPAAASASINASPPAPPVTPPKIDFATQVRPIFEARCTPCHFAGGKMYERLPFDRVATINKLGEKLFTRIKDEDERRLLREFLAQEATNGDAHP
jgi:hypothetical protein